MAIYNNLKMIGLSCRDNSQLFDIINSILDGYLNKKGLLKIKDIESIIKTLNMNLVALEKKIINLKEIKTNE